MNRLTVPLLLVLSSACGGAAASRGASPSRDRLTLQFEQVTELRSSCCGTLVHIPPSRVGSGFVLLPGSPKSHAYAGDDLLARELPAHSGGGGFTTDLRLFTRIEQRVLYVHEVPLLDAPLGPPRLSVDLSEQRGGDFEYMSVGTTALSDDGMTLSVSTWNGIRRFRVGGDELPTLDVRHDDRHGATFVMSPVDPRRLRALRAQASAAPNAYAVLTFDVETGDVVDTWTGVGRPSLFKGSVLAPSRGGDIDRLAIAVSDDPDGVLGARGVPAVDVWEAGRATPFRLRSPRDSLHLFDLGADGRRVATVTLDEDNDARTQTTSELDVYDVDTERRIGTLHLDAKCVGVVFLPGGDLLLLLTELPGGSVLRRYRLVEPG